MQDSRRIQAAFTDSSKLGGTPHAVFAFPFWVAVVAVIGFSMWGNEPDFWRYGRPRFNWPLPTYIFAAVWFTLFVMAGWMMAALAGTTDTAKVFRFTVHYSLFGAFGLAWIIATVSQFAINDGNYYESVNAGSQLGQRKPSGSAPSRRSEASVRSKSARSSSSVCATGEWCAYE